MSARTAPHIDHFFVLVAFFFILVFIVIVLVLVLVFSLLPRQTVDGRVGAGWSGGGGGG